MLKYRIKKVLKENQPQLIGLVIFLILISFVAIVFQRIGILRIQEIIANAGIWGPLIFILVHATTIVIIPFEGSVLMLTSATLFGYWKGVLYTIIAGFIGATVNFWLARFFGEAVISKLIGKNGVKKMEEISNQVDEHPILLIPLMSTTLFDLMGYAAGLTKVKYRNFFLAILVSSFINVPIYVAVGQGVIEGRNAALWITLAVTLMVILYFLTRFLLKKKK